MAWKSLRNRVPLKQMRDNTNKPPIPIEKTLLRRVATNLKAIRAEKGLTQEQLANAAGIAPRHLQKLEAGSANFTARTIARVSSALSIDAEILFCPEKNRDIGK